MSYIVEIRTVGDVNFSSNHLQFSTEAEAYEYALDLFCRWTAVEEYRVVQSDQPANYSFVDGHTVRLEA